MRVSENFILQEFINPVIYKRLGFRSLSAINCLAVPTIQTLRERLDTPIIINNWHSGGQYVDSGLRQPGDTKYAEFSAHKFGFGFDLKFPKLGIDKAFDEIMSSGDYAIIRIESLEHTRSKYGHLGLDWLHIEIGDSVEIEVFNP